MRKRDDVTIEMTLESIQGYQQGGPPHSVITGPAGEATSKRLQTEARRNGELAKRWDSVRVEATEGWSEPGDLWNAVGNELGADQGGQPLVRLDKALAASSRGLLVFVDRMDLLVERLAANDRDWELRKTLQTDQRIILIGSAEALPRQATSYKRAFYCFFSERYAG